MKGWWVRLPSACLSGRGVVLNALISFPFLAMETLTRDCTVHCSVLRYFIIWGKPSRRGKTFFNFKEKLVGDTVRWRL